MYLHAAGLETWAGILTMLVAARGMSVVQTWFIKVWGESYRGGGVKWLPPASEDINPWLGVYVSLSLVTAAIYLARLGFSYHGSFKAARKLLYACLLRVTSAPSRWLDENPTGRLLNRFTADIGSVDSTMNNSVTDVCNDLIGTVVSHRSLNERAQYRDILVHTDQLGRGAYRRSKIRDLRSCRDRAIHFSADAICPLFARPEAAVSL